MTAHWSGYLWVDSCNGCGAVYRATTKDAVSELLGDHRCTGGDR